MESGYAYSKLVDMHPVLGVCNRNDINAVRRYKEKYTNESAKSLYTDVC
jgi:hypothetical protein